MILANIQKIDVLYDRDLVTYYDQLITFPEIKICIIIDYTSLT